MTPDDLRSNDLRHEELAVAARSVLRPERGEPGDPFGKGGPDVVSISEIPEINSSHAAAPGSNLGDLAGHRH